ncbi:L-aminoadipate-semialdehyde dehydrogenase-phosphopantetheinyl transferase [Lates japonicus]|uniref:holo-[acyl-carrier-protein] synthase n=1 Tax=Lates japonicus TaxID=270547 RepID=A0AAD3MP35_LATJO|nr:L-aminoadipate-semialdehyde dehydrogenase-phosphopantetheinyl transferase [Lates japonicus]
MLTHEAVLAHRVVSSPVLLEESKEDRGRDGNLALPGVVDTEQALKESFIKAIGTGLGFNLQRVEFHLSSEPLTQGQALRQTKMHLDEEEEEDWIFEESLLDVDHHVAVALGPAGNLDSARHSSSLPPPTTFTLLSFRDLIASASPLTEEDPAYWDSFKMKAEAPQRQREMHTSR